MKYFFLTIALFVSTSISAQKFKDFVSDVKFDISIGLSSSSCDKRYDKATLGFSVGFDARKSILHYPNEASTIYGLVGLRYIKKGGKTTTELDRMFDKGTSLISNHVQIPIHPGFSYQFKKISLYIDLGPYIGFLVSEASENDKQTTELSSTEIGYGLNLGIRFKRFAIGFGTEQGLTKFAKYSYNQNSYEIKNSSGHFDLKWTF